MTKQTDLMNLAEKIQQLDAKDKQYWLYQLAYCRDSARHAPGHLSCLQRKERHKREKESVIFSLSRVLTGQREDTQIRRGVETFILTSKEESEAFYKTILGKEKPKKITTKLSSKSAMIKQNQGCERN